MFGLGAVFKEVFGFARDHFKGKRDIKLAKVQAEIALAEKRMSAEIDWDLAWANQAQHSWKDEYLTIIITAPMIAIFFPFLQPFIAQGFMLLETTVPDWYKTLVGATFAAAYGIRGLKDVMVDRGRNKVLDQKLSNGDTK